MGCDAAEVSVLITDDTEIAKLNSDFRKKPKPTDVLSFRMSEGEGIRANHLPLGDIVISLPTAKRQARQFGVSLQKELLRLLIHGLLHLMGYEHEGVSKALADRMRRQEKKLFQLFEAEE